MNITVFGDNTNYNAQVNDLPTLIARPEVTFWVDMTGPTAEDLRVMETVFHFHPLAIDDTKNQHQRPKVEEFPGYFFTIMNPVYFENAEFIFRELDIFIGQNYLVTVHNNADKIIDGLTAATANRRPVAGQMTSGYLMYLVADLVVDSYFPITDRVSEEIDRLEESILNTPRQTIISEIFNLKRSLTEMWRISGQQRDMFTLLMNRDTFATSQALQFYYRDVYDHVLRISDIISTYRDTLASLMDLYLSSVSNRLNIVVNRLAVITIVIGLLTVISGFYGMNFEHTWPDIHDPNGVLIVLFAMVALVAVALGVMKWQDLF
jgi:magnesium transporter